MCGEGSHSTWEVPGEGNRERPVPGVWWDGTGEVGADSTSLPRSLDFNFTDSGPSSQ